MDSQTEQLIEQRWAMLSNPHFGKLLGMTAITEADLRLCVGPGPLTQSEVRWVRFINDQWGNRN